MEGLLRGSRRARRVAQNSGPASTPEVNSTPDPQLPPSSVSDQQVHAAQRLLMNYYTERRSPSGSRGTPTTHTPRQGFDRDDDSPSIQPNLRHAAMETPDLRHPAARSPAETTADADEFTSPEEDGDDHFDDHEEYTEGPIDEQIEDQIEEDDQEGDMAMPFDPSAMGLKEISNLGKFTVSSHKPGNGVEEMRSDDTDEYWQSDGPQPHRMTVYFVKRVGIRDIRFYVDYQADESYTPTKILFKSGTSENNLIEFAVMELTTPSGWQQVPIAGTGGGPDGNTLACYVFQMQILENHQNGKDTHLRGIKIYAADTDARASIEAGSNPMAEMVEMIDKTALRGEDEEFAEEDSDQRIRRLERRLRAKRWDPSEGGMSEPDFMKEPEIR